MTSNFTVPISPLARNRRHTLATEAVLNSARKTAEQAQQKALARRGSEGDKPTSEDPLGKTPPRPINKSSGASKGKLCTNLTVALSPLANKRPQTLATKVLLNSARKTMGEAQQGPLADGGSQVVVGDEPSVQEPCGRTPLGPFNKDTGSSKATKQVCKQVCD